MKTYVMRLGCPKNLVDTEASVSLLMGAGCTFTEDPKDADLLIVSACSFLDSAWQETVDEVHRLAEFKRDGGSTKKLVLMGCLPKHRRENLRDELPAVDHFVAEGGHMRLPEIVRAWRAAEPADVMLAADPADRFAGFEDRVLLTPGHIAYVKIAEGCSRRCSFCAIPKIRGKMVSRPVDSIVREVDGLVARGVKEITLLAQDITSYNDQGRRFPALVDAVAATGIEWIRIFYVHPGSLTLDLARQLFRHPAVCRYLEAPIQHASDRLLRRMRRPYTRAHLERVFGSIRDEFPDVMIRSEVIVGFPGEDEQDFEALASFIGNAGFASLGIFTYSPEANTPAALLDGAVPRSVAMERVSELSDVQASVSFSLLGAERNKVHRVLVDRAIEDSEDGESEWRYAGRFYGQAHEVDGEVLLAGASVPVGGFVDARITDADTTDLRGHVL